MPIIIEARKLWATEIIDCSPRVLKGSVNKYITWVGVVGKQIEENLLLCEVIQNSKTHKEN